MSQVIPELFPVPGYPGYFASRYGDVWSIRTRHKRLSAIPHKLKPHILANGYPMVSLCIDGKQTNRKVATIILETFVGPRPEGMEARHFPDRNKLNNNIDNLSWSTHNVNQLDQVYHDTILIGTRNHAAKLTEEDVIAIRQSVLPKRILAESFCVTRRTISHIINRRTWAWLN